DHIVGPRGPSIAVDDPSIGSIPWSNVTAVLDEDGVVARTGAMVDFETSHYLIARDFGFELPGAAQPSGILLQVGRPTEPSPRSRIVDASVRLVRGGALAGGDHARPDSWRYDGTAVLYGGPDDLWGIAWSPEDLIDPAFGAAVAARYDAHAGN